MVEHDLLCLIYVVEAHADLERIGPSPAVPAEATDAGCSAETSHWRSETIASTAKMTEASNTAAKMSTSRHVTLRPAVA